MERAFIQDTRGRLYVLTNDLPVIRLVVNDKVRKVVAKLSDQLSRCEAHRLDIVRPHLGTNTLGRGLDALHHSLEGYTCRLVTHVQSEVLRGLESLVCKLSRGIINHGEPRAWLLSDLENIT